MTKVKKPNSSPATKFSQELFLNKRQLCYTEHQMSFWNIPQTERDVTQLTTRTPRQPILFEFVVLFHYRTCVVFSAVSNNLSHEYKVSNFVLNSNRLKFFSIDGYLEILGSCRQQKLWCLNKIKYYHPGYRHLTRFPSTSGY